MNQQMSVEESQLQKLLRKSLRMRERYMREAQQTFPETTRRFIHYTKQQTPVTPETSESSNCHCNPFLSKVRMQSSPQRRLNRLALSPVRDRDHCKGIHGLQFAVDTKP